MQRTGGKDIGFQDRYRVRRAWKRKRRWRLENMETEGKMSGIQGRFGLRKEWENIRGID